MFDNAALLFVLSAALSSFGRATGFSPLGPTSMVGRSLSSTTSITELDMMMMGGGGVAQSPPPPTMIEKKETFHRSLLAAQIANNSRKKEVGVGGKNDVVVDPNPVNIGWDSHRAVVSSSPPLSLSLALSHSFLSRDGYPIVS